MAVKTKKINGVAVLIIIMTCVILSAFNESNVTKERYEAQGECELRLDGANVSQDQSKGNYEIIYSGYIGSTYVTHSEYVYVYNQEELISIMQGEFKIYKEVYIDTEENNKIVLVDVGAEIEQEFIQETTIGPETIAVGIHCGVVLIFILAIRSSIKKSKNLTYGSTSGMGRTGNSLEEIMQNMERQKARQNETITVEKRVDEKTKNQRILDQNNNPIKMK